MIVHKYQRKGDYHTATNQECQDVISYVETEEYALAVIADGVTACKYSKIGAGLSCEAVKDFVKLEGSNLFHYPPAKTAYLLVEHILFFLERKAAMCNHDINEYASTLAFALVEKESGKTVLGNLGDGAVLLLAESGRKLLLTPKRHFGQPCLTTTGDAYKSLSLKQINLSLDDTLLLCTDGFLHASWPFLKKLDGDVNIYEQLDSALDLSCEQDDCSYIMVTRTRR